MFDENEKKLFSPQLVVVEVDVPPPPRPGEEGVRQDGPGAVERVTVAVEPAPEVHAEVGGGGGGVGGDLVEGQAGLPMFSPMFSMK